MLYVIWNNGGFQPAMGYWLKSFNKKPNPVPGTHFTIPEINYRESSWAYLYQLALITGCSA